MSLGVPIQRLGVSRNQVSIIDEDVNQSMIRVLVASNEPIIRQGLSAIIEQEQDMKVAAQFQLGEAIVQIGGPMPADVLVLNPGESVDESFRIIRSVRADSAMAILLLLTNEPDGQMSALMDVGANACIHRGSGVAQFLAGIRAIASDSGFSDSRAIGQRRSV